METTDLASRVRVELARQRKSQKALRESVGISRTSMHRRLNGESPFTSKEIVSVAEFLGVSVGDLFGESKAEASA